VRPLFFVALMLAFAAVASPSHAQSQTFGPFSIDNGQPNVIRLDGNIGGGDALNFRRALTAAPDAELVVLNSGGGLVSMRLLIADDIHSQSLSTLIPIGSGCYSACSLIFLAGADRQADGELGVHQISNGVGDLVSAQLSISDILDVLNRFDTPIEVLTIMFRTPPEDMYVFKAAEIERYGINRRRGDATPSTPVASVEPANSEEVRSAIEAAENTPDAPIHASPNLSGASTSRLSAIEDYARRPNRMVLYSGLDFFGEDIASRRVANAPACAAECLTLGDQCKAFTFNTDERVVRGPNCFLKVRRGVADGNRVAISGELLRASDPNPSSLTLGIIDPKAGVFEDVDIPGGDVSRRAYGSATTPQQCRLACVTNQQCIAFTFVKRKGECRLKGTVGQPRYMEGLVSGAKSLESFEATMIELD
jgi:hypothetical protein